MPHRSPFVWPIGAAVQVGLGIGLLTRPGDYLLDVYVNWQFAVIPRTWWGIAFLVIGALAVGARTAPQFHPTSRAERRLATGCVSASSFLFAMWAFNFLAAFLASPAQTSVNPVLLWGFAAFAQAADASTHGTGR